MSRGVQLIARQLEAEDCASPCQTLTPEHSVADVDDLLGCGQSSQRERKCLQQMCVSELMRDIRCIQQSRLSKPSQLETTLVAAPALDACPSCGNVYAADSVFCRKCGKRRDQPLAETSLGSPAFEQIREMVLEGRERRVTAVGQSLRDTRMNDLEQKFSKLETQVSELHAASHMSGVRGAMQREHQHIKSDMESLAARLSASIEDRFRHVLRRDDATQDLSCRITELKQTVQREHRDIHLKVDQQAKDLKDVRRELAMKPSPLNIKEIKQMIQREQQNIHFQMEERLDELSATLSCGASMDLHRDGAVRESESALDELRAALNKEHEDINSRIVKQLQEMEVLRGQAAIQQQSLTQLLRRLDALEGTRNSASSSLRSLVEIPSPRVRFCTESGNSCVSDGTGLAVCSQKEALPQKLVIVDRSASQDASLSLAPQSHSPRCLFPHAASISPPGPLGPNPIDRRTSRLSSSLVVMPGQPSCRINGNSPSRPTTPAAIRSVSPQRGFPCHACNNLCMPDSKFCRICGHPRLDLIQSAATAGSPRRPELSLSCSARQA